MTVSLIRAAESHSGTTGSVSQTSFTFAVGQAGDAPKGILVFVFQGVSDTEAITSVTYGSSNANVPAVTGGRASDSTTEPGACKAFFLGSAVPSGAQSVVVNRTNNTTTMYAVAYLLGGAADLKVPITPYTLNQNAAMAQQSIVAGSATTQIFAAAYSGGVTTPTATNMTIGTGTYLVYSTYAFYSAYETTPTTGTRTRGLICTTDDLGYVIVTVGEVATFEGAFTCEAPSASAVIPTAVYPSSITGLSAGAGYHVRSYATTAGGTSYGDEVDFSAAAGAATWEGAFTCEAVSARSVAVTVTQAVWEAAFTCAGVSASAAVGAVTHAVWEGAFTVEETTSTAITAGLTSAIWEGAFACDGTSAAAVVASPVQAVWEGSFLCEALSATATVGSKTEAVWEGAFTCEAVSQASTVGSATQAVWEGGFTCESTSATAAVGRKISIWDGAFTCEGVSVVAAIGAATQAVWEGAFACEAVSSVVAGSTPTQAIWEAGFTCEAISARAVVGSKTEAIWEASLTCEAVSSTTVASTPLQAVWEAAFTCESVSSVVAASSPVQAVWEGAFTCESIGAVAVAGGKIGATYTYEGAFTCEGVSAVSTTGAEAQAVWEGSFTCEAIGSVAVIGDKSGASVNTWEGAFTGEAASATRVIPSASYPSSLTSLSPTTDYHVRAYATTAAGTWYGSEIDFQSETEGVKEGSFTVEGATSAVLVPTVSFPSAVTGLTTGTNYRVRAYASTSTGTTYGNEIAFSSGTVREGELTCEAVSSVAAAMSGPGTGVFKGSLSLLLSHAGERSYFKGSLSLLFSHADDVGIKEGAFTCESISTVTASESSVLVNVGPETTWEGSFTSESISMVTIIPPIGPYAWEGTFRCETISAIGIRHPRVQHPERPLGRPGRVRKGRLIRKGPYD